MTKKLYLKNSPTSKPGISTTKPSPSASSQKNLPKTYLVDNKLLTPYVSLLYKLLWDDININRAISLWGSDFNGWIAPINERTLNIIRTSSAINSSIMNNNIYYNNLIVNKLTDQFLENDNNINSLNYTIFNDDKPDGILQQSIEQGGPFCTIMSILQQITMSFKYNHFPRDDRLDPKSHIDLNKLLSCIPLDKNLDYLPPGWKDQCEKYLQIVKDLDETGNPEVSQAVIYKIYKLIFDAKWQPDLRHRETSCYPISVISPTQQCREKNNIPTYVPPKEGLPDQCDLTCVKDYFKFVIERFSTSDNSNATIASLCRQRSNSLPVTFKRLGKVRAILLTLQIPNYTTWDSVKSLSLEDIQKIYSNLGFSANQIEKLTDTSLAHVITLVKAAGAYDKEDKKNCYTFTFQNTWQIKLNEYTSSRYFDIEVCEPDKLISDTVYLSPVSFWDVLINPVLCNDEEHKDKPKPWDKCECEFQEFRCDSNGEYLKVNELEDYCEHLDPVKHHVYDPTTCECVEDTTSTSSSSSSSSTNVSSSSSYYS